LPQRLRLGSLREAFVTAVSPPGRPAGPVAAMSHPGGGSAAGPGRPPGPARPGDAARRVAALATGRGGPAAHMTPRGAVLAMFSLFFPGTLTAGWLHLAVLTGLSFVAGCALTARYTRRDGLLTVVLTPPLIFLISLVGTEVLTSHADTIRHTLASAAEGTILTLAAVAPWLFAGVVISLAIALFRGLPQCIQDLRDELRGDLAARRPSGQRDPRGGSRGS
jgi:hypothetical protein